MKTMARNGQCVIMLALGCLANFAQTYSPPAGIRPPYKNRAASILPGGRVIAPAGEQYGTDAGPCAMGVSPSGRTVVTINHGRKGPSLTVLEHGKKWEVRHLPLSITVSCSLSFAGERAVWVSEEDSGRTVRIDLKSGEPKWIGEIKTLEETRDIAHPGSIAISGRIYASDPINDCINVTDPASGQLLAQIPVRIPHFEDLRGIIPAGLAFDAQTGWLLVAETGINAVGVIDTRSEKVIGHIPAGWAPSRVAVHQGTVAVMNEGSASISIYPLPAASDLPADSDFVMRAAGFESRPAESRSGALSGPSAITHVVLILKPGHSFDEVLGDVIRAANGTVMSEPVLARLGTQGYASGQGQRLSLHGINITPNLHAIAERWAFSDNFYAGPEGLAEQLLQHLVKHGISVYTFPTGKEISDTERAARFIHEIAGMELPQFVLIRFPQDFRSGPRPALGFPYAESFAADYDLAVGRILEYLSATKWWPNVAIFVAEDSAQGMDHIHPRRTLLFCAGPWARRNYVSHRNTDASGLIRTIREIFDLPPIDLFDAAAASLSDCFRPGRDLSGYQALSEDPRLYKPK